MAKTETERPGTSGSQFFVVTAEDAQLPPDYALLGKVTKGQDVVDKIGVVPTVANDEPAEPIVIRSIKVGNVAEGERQRRSRRLAGERAPSSCSSTRLRSAPPP